MKIAGKELGLYIALIINILFIGLWCVLADLSRLIPSLVFLVPPLALTVYTISVFNKGNKHIDLLYGTSMVLAGIEVFIFMTIFVIAVFGY